jgi:RimJ/RimL family protein N-acetyltransferase
MLPIIGTEFILDVFQESYIQMYLDAFVEQVQILLHVPNIFAEQQYLAERLSLVALQQTFFFVLLHRLSGRCIGAIEIRGPEHPGQLYCWLHPDFWGKSYFQEAMRLAAQVYFSMTGLLCFTARVDVTNIRSYYALKKTGFADYRLVAGAYGMQFELVLLKSR